MCYYMKSIMKYLKLTCLCKYDSIKHCQFNFILCFINMCSMLLSVMHCSSILVITYVLNMQCCFVQLCMNQIILIYLWLWNICNQIIIHCCQCTFMFFQSVNFESSLFFYKKIKLLNLKYLKEKSRDIHSMKCKYGAFKFK